MICEKCGLEYEGEMCPACVEEEASFEKTITKLPDCDSCATVDCDCEAEAQEETSPKIIEEPKKKICKRCGYEYEGPYCPVCVAKAKKEKARKANANKKSSLGLAGMIVALSGIAADLLLPVGIATLPLGIASLVLSIIGKKKNKKDKFATAGIWLSVVKILLNVIMLAIDLILSLLTILFFIFIVIIAAAASGRPLSDIDSVF